jgi:hypothetical protein
MMQRLRRHLTYANVMATGAMFVALGGASYAAVTLPRNSVGARQLKAHAVTPSKLSRSTRALVHGRIGPVGPQGPKGDAGPRGGTGLQGAAGHTVLNGAGAPSGTTGSNGDFFLDTTAHAIYGPKTGGGWGSPTSLVGPAGATTVTVRAYQYTVPAGLASNFFVPCNAGETAVGGGGSFVTGDVGLVGTGATVSGTGPSTDNGSIYLTDGVTQPKAWAVTAGNGSGSPQALRVFVLCASP